MRLGLFRGEPVYKSMGSPAGVVDEVRPDEVAAPRYLAHPTANDVHFAQISESSVYPHRRHYSTTDRIMVFLKGGRPP